jgi:hypothetical protein
MANTPRTDAGPEGHAAPATTSDPSSAPTPTLVEYLDQEVPAKGADEELAEYLKRLDREAQKKETAAGKATRLATAHRLRLALDLRAGLPEDAKAARRWKRETAKNLGWTTRNVRNYLSLGEVLADPETAFPLSVLDLPIRRMEKALKTFAAHGTFAAPKQVKAAPSTPDERKEAFISKVSSAVKAIYGGHDEEVPGAVQALTEAFGVTSAQPPQGSPITEPEDAAGTPEKSRKKAWYVIRAVRPVSTDGPLDMDKIADGALGYDVLRCAVRCSSEKEAVELFTTGRPDTGEIITAERLNKVAKELHVPRSEIGSYMDRPRGLRKPTLEEYLANQEVS